ncbi:MAG: DNA repair protein RecO [Chloroflexota bacterium]
MEHRQRAYRTHGVILKRRNQGDADRILTIFTPHRGKLDLIAKGIRKTSSRKAGHLESFSHASLMVAQARTWDIITEVVTVESYRHIRDDLETIGRASYVGELLDSFTELHDENQGLWDVLLITLRELNRLASQPDAFDAKLLLRWYEIHLLSFAGFQPQLFTCLASGEDLKEEINYLSIEEGGVYSPQYGTDLHHTEPLEPDALKILRHLLRSSWPNVASLQIRHHVMMRVENVLHRMLINILERQLKSVDFLRKVSRMQRN